MRYGRSRGREGTRATTNVDPDEPPRRVLGTEGAKVADGEA